MRSIKIHRRVAELGEVSIFYRDTETIGQTILCLHGRWGRGETWVDFIHRYGAKYRILAPDQRGHGLSSKPISSYSADQMARDMIALLKHLSIGSAIVVGHSMGGHIAGLMAACYPEHVSALAILDKSAAGPAEPCQLLPEPIDPITKNWPLPFDSLTEAQECIRNDMESDLSYQYFMNSLIETVAGYDMMFSPRATAANIAQYQCWFNLLPKIRCPVMLVRAKGGNAVTEEDFSKMKSLISKCTAFEMANADHNVHLGNKEEFYGYFDSFLNGL
jgi:2-succinyl-6-hydroxy-2,4-cyclohexadiene-1-carboxylate synthase